jgi:hypothetical protein
MVVPVKARSVPWSRVTLRCKGLSLAASAAFSAGVRGARSKPDLERRLPALVLPPPAGGDDDAAAPILLSSPPNSLPKNPARHSRAAPRGGERRCELMTRAARECASIAVCDRERGEASARVCKDRPVRTSRRGDGTLWPGMFTVGMRAGACGGERVRGWYCV